MSSRVSNMLATCCQHVNKLTFQYNEQELIVLERSARMNLDPGKGDQGDVGDG